MQILDTTNVILVEKKITPRMFGESNKYKEFGVEYQITANKRLRYRVKYFGGREVRINKISQADRDASDLLLSRQTQYYEQNKVRRRRAFETFDDHLQKVLDDHAGFSALWRFAVSDEPAFLTLESTGYVENFFRQKGQKAISAIGNHNCGTSKEHCVHVFPRWTNPDVMLIDGYPIGDFPQPYTPYKIDKPDFFAAMPDTGDYTYNTVLQDRWDRHLLPILQSARESALTQNPPIPFWYIAQAHSWKSSLRDPTPEEIRAMVYLALAHGAKGIYYFMYSSHIDKDGVADIDGLVDANYGYTPKWEEVKSLNAMLKELDDTLLDLTSNEVFASDDLADFVHSLSNPDSGSSDTADYHLGTFTHTDSSRYLMMVNRRCESSDHRNVTVTLDADKLSGSNYVYRLTDVYKKKHVTDSSSDDSSNPSFSISLEPGEGKLYRIEPIATMPSSVTADTEPVFSPSGTAQEALTGHDFSFTRPSANGGNGPLSYSVSGLCPGLTVTDSLVSGQPSKVGEYAITWTATDTDGDEATYSLQIVVAADTEPSFAESGASRSTLVGSYFSFSRPSASGGNGSLRYSVSGLCPGLTVTDSLVSGQPSTAGKYTITWTATDTDGDEATYSLQIVVAADTEPSFAESGTERDALTRHRFSFTRPAASGGNGSLTYSVHGSCPGLTVTDSLVRGRPRSSGQCRITWTVRDADGDSDTYALQISVAADTAPSFAASGTYRSAIIGQYFSFSRPSASGGDGSLRYSVSGSCSGLTVASSAVRGQPSKAGPCRITWTAHDIDGDTDTYTLQISVAADTAPSFTSSGASRWALVGSYFSFTRPSARGGNGSLRYSVSGSCAGLTVTTSSVSGSPRSAGQCGITWTVRDADGDTDTYALQLSVRHRRGS